MHKRHPPTPTNHVKVLLDLDLGGGQLLAQVLVVGGRGLEEVEAAGAHVGDGAENVGGVEGDVLHTGAAVVLDILLDLRLALAGCRLVDGHLDGLVVVRHHHRAQGAKLRVHLRVVDRPEAVELEALDVPVHIRLHLVVRLVANLL